MDDDELDQRRRGKEAAEGLQQQIGAFTGSAPVEEFAQWILENMPCISSPNALAGLLAGALIGSWFDEGVEPEKLKEYFSRFIDMSWKQYQAALSYLPPK